jgi:hypothetical protein
MTQEHSGGGDNITQQNVFGPNIVGDVTVNIAPGVSVGPPELLEANVEVDGTDLYVTRYRITVQNLPAQTQFRVWAVAPSVVRTSLMNSPGGFQNYVDGWRREWRGIPAIGASGIPLSQSVLVEVFTSEKEDGIRFAVDTVPPGEGPFG